MKRLIKNSILIVAITIVAYFVLLFFDALTLGKPKPRIAVSKITPGGWDYNLTRFREIKNYRNLDVVFVGSSTCYETYDTRFFKENGIHSFNMGSANQTPLNSYFLLKNYYNSLSPKVIVVDVTPDNLTSDGLEGFSSLVVNLPASYSMVQMCASVKSIYGWNTLLRDYLISRSINAYENLTQEEIKNKKYILGGYVEDTSSQCSDLTGITPSTICVKETQTKYLQKMILDFPDSKFVLIIQPLPKETISSYKNFTEVVNSLDSIASVNKVHFYNYSSLPYDSYKDFFDEHHLNAQGVEKFMTIIVPLIAKEL